MVTIGVKSSTGRTMPALQRRGRKRAPTTARQAAELRVMLVRLVTLLQRRWSIPLLAELARGDTGPGGAKFITLANRLKITRVSLRQTLDHLMAHDYVMRNPGVGHPMRPEYLLADDGYSAAPHCTALIKLLDSNRLQNAAFNKWSLPIVLAIGERSLRFNELKALLPDVTSRALTLALKNLVTQRLVSREVHTGYPPAASYQLTPAAQRWLPLVRSIASSGL